MDLNIAKEFFGYYLLENGVITIEQLEEALEWQRENSSSKKMIGEILVMLEFCTDEDIAGALAQRAGVPYLTLESYSLDEAAASLISSDIARKYKVLPIGFEENKLLVAMKNPTDIIAVDDLRLLTGYPIQPVVLPASEMEAVAKKNRHEHSGCGSNAK